MAVQAEQQFPDYSASVTGNAFLEQRYQFYAVEDFLGAYAHLGEIHLRLLLQECMASPFPTFQADNVIVHAVAGPQQQQQQPAVLSGDPVSDLTCNAPHASKKRARGGPDYDITTMLPQPQQRRFMIPTSKLVADDTKPFADNEAIARLHACSGATTSGTTPAVVSIPPAHDLASHLYSQSFEIDALIRLQSEKLRVGFEETRRRHIRAVAAAAEQSGAKRLREKEAELDNARRRNAELEERVRQVTAETQAWFNLARNNEAVVAALRNTLEHALLRKAAAASAAAPQEGYGDSDEDGVGAAAPVFPADDALSYCGELAAEGDNVELRRRRGCIVCGEREVCVLVLPCRHLCLCKGCESNVDKCPICNSSMKASLQVFMCP